MDNKREELLRSLEFGQYLLELRTEDKVSLAKLGVMLNVSANYLSEIERGRKTPSDSLIRGIAKYFEVDEDILYRKLGRVPLAAVEELNDSPELQEVLSQIKKNPKLSEEDRGRLYKQLRVAYNDMIGEG